LTLKYSLDDFEMNILVIFFYFIEPNKPK